MGPDGVIDGKCADARLSFADENGELQLLVNERSRQFLTPRGCIPNPMVLGGGRESE